MNSEPTEGNFDMSMLRTVASLLLPIIFVLLILGNLFYFFSYLKAAGQQIDPDGAGLTTQGTRTTCGTAANFDCVNDAVSSTSVPSTSADYVTFARTQFDSYTLGTISNVATATVVQVFLYHKEGGTNMQFDVSLWNSAETVQVGTTQLLTISTVSQWNSVSFTSLTLNQAALDGLRVRTLCSRPGGGAATNCIDYALYAYVTYTPVQNVTVGTTSAMQNLDVGTTSAHVGGSFAIRENTSSRNITSITIAESGTVNGLTNLDNVRLRFEYDTSNPYDCASESHAGTEIQYGSTDTDGFSAANGTSTFSSSTVSISTTQSLCIYPVLDVLSTAGTGETMNLRIIDPSFDVVGSGSAVVGPTSTVPLSGTTTLQKSDLRQMRYHWRNDDGNEAGATSATGGTEGTVLPAVQQLVAKRLRLEVSNEGNKTSPSTGFRIEYAQKISTCSAVSVWTDVGGASGDWDMFNTANLTDGNDTTNIANGVGGVTDENTTFLTPNVAVKDTSSQVTNTTLTSSHYIEMEFSIVPTLSATEGNTYCFRVSDGGVAINAYDIYPEATVASDVTVSATSTQTASVPIPSTNTHSGGGFVIVSNTAGTRIVSSVTLYASGTVDRQNDIDNIKLVYDLDVVAPYNCTGETYGGAESQYGATDTDGFSTAGTSTFTGSLSASTTQGICFYIVYDVLSTATNGETIDFYMSNPSTNVVLSSGTLSPNTELGIAGMTTFTKADPQQIHYHWRTDTGTESTATSSTNGAEDTVLTQVSKNLPQRLRLLVSNEGGATATNYQYRLEFAQKITSCSAALGWTDVGTTNDSWNMTASQLVEGDDTTNIANGVGGVTDENTTFLTPNGGQRETTSQTGNITLTSTQYVELEYSIVATATSTSGATYCFRLTNAGTVLDTYIRYPEASIKNPTDFLVQRGVSTITGDTLTITAGVDYVTPSASTSAFLRITNTHHTGAGDNVATANQNSDSVTAYITNPSNILTSVTFARGIGAVSNTRVAWEIVEYIGSPGGENEIKVRQQGPLTYGASNLGATTTVASGVVTDADIVVFITGQFNPDVARANYNTGLSTASWNSTVDTATFTRGEAGADAVIVSYAVVEFTGSNWAVQRTPDHAYTNAGTTETESITTVGSLTRAFIHAQKRVGTALNQHEDYGHEVWLSGLNQVSFRLDSGANTVSSQVSVAWIIENTQTTGDKMVVTRSSGTQSGGTAPLASTTNIGATLDDITTSSIFLNNSGSGAVNSYPEPMIAARIISTTQYELWMSNTGNSRSYQTEIVEWPTAIRKITQNYYRFYVNNDALDPTDPWPVGVVDLGENTEVTGLDSPIVSGGVVRIRMSLNITSAAMIPGVDSFKLQYGARAATCGAISEAEWKNLGNIGSTTAIWRATSTPVTDGTALSTDPPVAGALNLSVSDVAGTFEEENNTVVTPFIVDANEDIEYDWAIQDNGATDKTSYCFRMVEADGALLTAYNNYPTIRTVGYGTQSQDWRWYDDAQNATPTTTLAATNTAPVDIDFDNAINLRLTLREVNGAPSTNTKFKLQFSESSSFATSTDVGEIGTCTNFSYWCYVDGAGTDNATITARTLSDADTCTGGVGNGCGMYNESGTTTGTFFHQVGAATEFSFTIRSSGARPNRVYYFRAYDKAHDEVVPLGSGEVYPSLVSKGASLVFVMSGLASSTVLEGVTLDRDTTSTQIAFGSLGVGSLIEAGHRLSVDTNGTEGHQIFMMMNGNFLTSSGAMIHGVTGTNAVPTAWATGCDTLATSCFGYHTGDDTLFGGSTRFSAIDTYSRISTTTPEEVSYSSQPVIGDTTDIVFRIFVRQLQDAGQYMSSIRYISTPIF